VSKPITLRERLGRWLIGPAAARARHASNPAPGVRAYQGAKQSYMTAGFGSGNSSADAELHSSLSALRSRSRQLLRDAPYAKRACKVVVDNVIGPGVGMQAQVKTTRDDYSKRVNDEIEAQFAAWSRAENCHTGGSLHFADFERACLRQVFEAGEVIVRKHYSKFGASTVPLCLELIEAERLADEFAQPGVRIENGTLRLGVEVDRFFRPVAYWIRERHPGDLRSNLGGSERYERVPASDIFHLRIIERWPQTRGEPWMHAVVRKLNDMDGYSEAEIYAARAAANVLFSIEEDGGDGDPLSDTSDTVGTPTADGSDQFNVEPGMGMRLGPGQKLNMANPTRPNTALDPFMRYMLREVAAGTNVSYESISRDFSQSNFSSSRLGVYEDRDAWRILQAWWVRAFRAPLHREWLQLAVLARAVRSIGIDAFAQDPERYCAVKFKPRGWGLIDPAKDVPALKEAIKGGLMTRSHAISATADGLDIEDIDSTREQELEAARERGLVFDTDPDVFAAPPPAPAPDAAGEEPPEKEPEVDDAEDSAAEAERRLDRDRVARLERQLDLHSVLRMVPPAQPVSLSIEQGAIVVHNTQPAVTVERTQVNVAPAEVRIDQAPPVVNVAAPEVRVAPTPVVVNVPPAEFTVNVPEQSITFEATMPAPVVNVRAAEQAAPVVNVAAPVVNVAAPEVTVTPTLEATLNQKDSKTTHKRNAAGDLVESTTTYGN
jgi:lambda family phage portal protein